MATVKIGWDGPLRPRYQFALPELMSAIGRHAPVRSGRLQRALRTLRNYHVTGSSFDPEVSLDVPLEYAEIQDQGGISPTSGKDVVAYMRMPWGWRTRRKASRIKGSRYVERGVADFVNSPTGITATWQ